MRKEKIIKYGVSGLFGISFLITLMPVISCAGFQVSLWDVITMSGGLKELADVFNSMTAEVAESMDKAKAFLIVFCFLPIAAGAAVLILEEKAMRVAAYAGVVINNLLGIFIISKVKEGMDLVKEAVDIFGMTTLIIKVTVGTVICWGLVYLAIIGLLVWKEKADTELSVHDQSTYTEVPDTQYRSDKQAPHPQQKQPDYGASPLDFNGAIVGFFEPYSNKAYPLEPEEQIIIGAPDTKCSIILDFLKFEECVSIQYDRAKQEYWLQVSEKGVTFMNSGQPLGNDRRYYLQRGTQIYIKNRKNGFLLA